jgi:hypothetical protein
MVSITSPWLPILLFQFAGGTAFIALNGRTLAECHLVLEVGGHHAALDD